MQNNLFFILFFILFFFQINKSFSQQKDIYNFSADKITYSQDNNVLEATGSVIAKNQEGQTISADKVLYNKNTQILKTFGNSNYSDIKNQKLSAENFNYNLSTKIISAENNVKFEDNKNNIYYFSKTTSDDKFIEILGYDLKANLSKDNFETEDKFNSLIEPTLIGKEASIKDKITIIKEGKFTSCKSTNEKEKCPFWNLNSSIVTHDKEKKEITYRNAYLDLNKVPVFFTPYFSHPDPTVKRKAGFLAPDFSSLSKETGSTIKIPYFYPISNSADLTISPVYYFKQHPLLLGEYREKFKNGDLSLEGGITQGYKTITKSQTDGSRNHLYGNLYLNLNNIIFKENDFNVKFQRVNNSTYLQANKINSNKDGFKKNLISQSDTNLTNEIYLNSYGPYENLNLRVAAYQKISITKRSDQYSYLLPGITYSKFKLFNYDQLNFLSNFSNLNSNTNQNKSILFNKIGHSSEEDYNPNTGVVYKFLSELNNYNYYSDFKTPNENLNSQIDPVIGVNTTLPFGKISKETEQFLIPRILTRYSPGKMQNATSNNITLNSDNLFVLNRMNSDELIEKNLSLNIGLDWLWKEKNLYKPKEATFAIGQVIKFNRDADMPIKSSLQNKNSDIVSKVTYSEKENFNIVLKSTIDNNLKDMFSNDLTIKSFLKEGEVNFNFYDLSHHIGNARYAKADLIKNITNNTLFKIAADRNFKTNFTSFTKLALINENECIRYSINLQRNYFENNDVKPATNVFFSITLLPFGENYTSGNLISSLSQ